MTSRQVQTHRLPSQRIAIVGIGGIFPQSPTLDHFWTNIAGGVSTAREVPDDRWLLSTEDAYDPGVAVPDRVYSKHGCFIEDFELDPQELALEPTFLGQLDPVFHLALHAARQAFDDAVTEPLDLSRMGVIFGNIVLPTDSSSALAREYLGRTFEEKILGREAGGWRPEAGGESFQPPASSLQSPASSLQSPASSLSPLNRYVAGLPGGVVAKALGLGGGSFTLDAACASSLYALKLAADELLSGRADAMLAGGVSRPDCLYTQMGFSQLHALSRSGRCSPFDARADGLVVGEGAGIVVLKRLGDAIEHGDQIHATIEGIGLSNDVGGSLLSPRSEGQLRAMRSAYQRAGWSPGDVDLIECHATGTPVGDATELQSLHALWEEEPSRPGQCVLGAVKANVGHLLTGAGAAGLIKVLLSMKRKTLPPIANFTTPAPDLTVADSPFEVLCEAKPWEQKTEHSPRRAAINAFGFGGINAHVLLEEWNGNKDEGGRMKDERRKTESSSFHLHPSSFILHPSKEVAIVGMGVRFGKWESLRAFQEYVLGGPQDESSNIPSPLWGEGQGEGKSSWFEQEKNGRISWQGFTIDELRVPMGRFKIPPTELEEMLPQQLLMLGVADAALRDAGLGRDLGEHTGVFIGIGLDLNTTNFHFRWSLLNEAREWARELKLNLSQEELAEWTQSLREAAGPPLSANRTMGALGGIVASRLAREFGVGGPSFTISSEESSGLRALETAVRLLQQEELDQAIVGAVDLAGDIRAVLATHAERPFSPNGKIRPLDAKANGTIVGEGAAAVILKRAGDAIRDGNRIYAVIKGVGSASGDGCDTLVPSQKAYSSALERAYADAFVSPGSIGLIETHGSGHPTEDGMEARSLTEFFGTKAEGTKGEGGRGKGEGNFESISSLPPSAFPLPPSRDCALGSVKADIGHTGAAAGLASLVKASLCLYQEILPPLRNFQQQCPELASWTNCYVPKQPQYWLRNRKEGPRQAGVSSFSVDGNCVHVVLQACETTTTPRVEVERRQPLGAGPEALFAIEANDYGELAEGLAKLRYVAEEATNLRSIEAFARRWLAEHPINPDKRLGIALIARDKGDLDEKIAIANRLCDSSLQPPVSSLHRGEDRVFHSPEPLGPQGEIGFVFPGSGNLSVGMAQDLFVRWPEILRNQDAENLSLWDQFGADLLWNSTSAESIVADHKAMIFGQVSLGCAVCDLLGRFGVQPKAVIGYSLGESAGLFALRAWTNRDKMFRRMRDSTLFGSDLVHPFDAARKKWQLANNEKVDWISGVIDCPAELVRLALADRQRVYLLTVNTPTQCVIGGQRDSVLRLARDLGSTFLPLSSPSSVHCEVVAEVEQAYRELHLLPTTPPAGIRYYSVARGGAYDVNEQSAARAIVAQALETIDFPAVIEAAYADGVRLFLEMGPAASCSRMIGEILSGQPHFASSVCQSAEDSTSSLLRILGRLIAERVPVDPKSLYGQETTVLGHQEECREIFSDDLVLAVGGKPFDVPRPLTLTLSPEGRGDLVDSQNSMLHPEAELGLEMIQQMTATEFAKAQAHETYLRMSKNLLRTASSALSFQLSLAEKMRTAAGSGQRIVERMRNAESSNVECGLRNAEFSESFSYIPHSAFRIPHSESVTQPTVVFSREQCLEFASGSIEKVLGPEFAEVDSFPTRVRLPDEPLMLVDRILRVEGVPRSLSSGAVITEHDIHPDAWYLDCGRIPTCIAVEAGQADLFLSGYLGIDFETRGLAVYRLLDAVVTFHSSLPGPGEVIHYDVKIKEFFRQNESYLFRFEFDATVAGRLLLTMREGCAGFFTTEELAAGKGIVHTALDRRRMPSRLPDDWQELVPRSVESYSEAQVGALRTGNLAGCFGQTFDALRFESPPTIPGGRMKLVDRIVHLDPAGGRFGLGIIRAEADIHPDDWFLTCHFSDDRVMPGTLMFECCLHTLRIFLLRMGWVCEWDEVVCQPVPGISSRLKCRGQVIESTRTATYEISIKELGYRPEPYAIADALMYADGKPIVEITDMSIRFVGLSRESIRDCWRSKDIPHSAFRIPHSKKPAIFDTDRILAFAIGKPSEAFGERYRIFDQQRVIARLPGPPYQFLDRITELDAKPWEMVAGGTAEAQYDVPPNAWYFTSDRQSVMPFAVLLEVALQPCGWLAAYVGSALTIKTDLSFRNLGGSAIQHELVLPDTGTLTTTVRLTKVSSSGGMIIQNYDYRITSSSGVIYEGDTYFGFFSKESLAQQVGLREAAPYVPTQAELAGGRSFDFPSEPPFPDAKFRMIDRIDTFVPDGGPFGLGFIRGTADVDPEAWFFGAHFYQDPVWPGSLGLESLLQLLKVVALDRWGPAANEPVETLSSFILHPSSFSFETVAREKKHDWVYRGQVIPTNNRVTVEAVIRSVDDADRMLEADGYLSVDGRIIYGMNNFSLRMVMGPR